MRGHRRPRPFGLVGLFGKRSLVFFGLGLAALASQAVPGCDRNSPTYDKSLTAASRSIGPEGGSLRLGQALIQASAGALASTTPITINRLPGDDTGPLGDLYQLSPDGLTFSAAVTLTLPSPVDEQAGIGLWVGDEWESVAGSHYGPAAGVVVGEVVHFSRYACLRLCQSSATCSSGRDCRRGVCQPPRGVQGTGGGQGTGGSGIGGATGTGGVVDAGGSGIGGSGIGGGGPQGTGGSGIGGATGTGGVVDAGGIGGVIDTGGIGGAIAGSGGDSGTGGLAGTGGTVAACADGGTPPGCNAAVGTACNTNGDCASGYCQGAVSTAGCTTDAICTCQLRPAGAACTANAQCMGGACLTASSTACTVDAACTCQAPGG
jgi:hypothetical protein